MRERGTAEDVGGGWCLWVDLDGPEALERLRDFRPEPSLRVRTGSPDHEHVYWTSHEPISAAAVHRANRRLALALGGDMGACGPARILRPVGSQNHKHEPAQAVVCARLEPVSFTLADVVAGLPDSEHYRHRTRPMRRTIGDSSRALAGLVRTVASAQVTNRNKALYWAACRVREHAEQGRLDANEAWPELRDAAEDAGLSKDEIERTMHSAFGEMA